MPPPPTIYIRGALQDLLHAHPPRPLAVDCETPESATNVEEGKPPQKNTSGEAGAPPTEGEDSCSYTAGDITIKSRLLCEREREYLQLDSDSSTSQQGTGAGSSTDKPPPKQASRGQPERASTSHAVDHGTTKGQTKPPLPRRHPAADTKITAAEPVTDPAETQIATLPSGRTYPARPVPKGKDADPLSEQPTTTGSPALLVEDVTASLAAAREHRKCLAPSRAALSHARLRLEHRHEAPHSSSLSSSAAELGTEGTTVPIPVGPGDVSTLEDCPPALSLKIRAATRLKPKAKTSTAGNTTRRPARRLSKTRKPVDHPEGAAAADEVYDPNCKPDPASRPKAKKYLAHSRG